MESLNSPPSAPKDARSLVEAAMSIAQGIARLPVLDSRSPDEILGYNEFGLPE